MISVSPFDLPRRTWRSDAWDRVVRTHSALGQSCPNALSPETECSHAFSPGRIQRWVRPELCPSWVCSDNSVPGLSASGQLCPRRVFENVCKVICTLNYWTRMRFLVHQSMILVRFSANFDEMNPNWIQKFDYRLNLLPRCSRPQKIPEMESCQLQKLAEIEQ